MKLGMTSLTFRAQSPEQVVQAAAAAGLDGIEWGVSENHVPLGNEKRAEEIRRLTREHGLSVFSLGSYCRMTEPSACREALCTAAALGAPVIRIWAGTSGSGEITEEQYRMVVENTRTMADKAASYGIALGFEYHENTLTDTAQSAVKLVQEINRKNVGLYWQPNCSRSGEENLRNFQTVIPHLCGNLHVHNHTPETGYQPLRKIEAALQLYYNAVKDKDWNVMIEFVKDGTMESLLDDAATLRKIIQ